jgi:hypothetical protein
MSFSSRRRWRPALAVLGATALTLISVPAVADDIYNNLDTTVDAAAELMPLDAGGANGTTVLALQTQNDDGKNGCNLTGSTIVTFAVNTSNASVATVSPSSVTFDSCGATRTLTVTPHDAGSATISLTQTANTTTGTFNVAPATFTVNVTEPTPTNTAPTLNVAGVDMGANYDKGSVPAATCEVTDAEDGNSSFPATLSAITGPNASDGIGSQTASCSYTDTGGLTASASKTYNIVDPTAPVITYDLDPATPSGANGWYTGDVTLTWHVSDPQSPNSLETTGCVDQNITADQTSVTYSCSATSAGGSSGPVEVSIKRDAGKPTIGHTLNPTDPNGNGWYKEDVTVTFSCDDATSGIDTCLADGETGSSKTLGEGENQSVSGTATDLAGNTQTDTASGINIDETAPTIGHTLNPTGPNANGWFNTDVTVSFNCDDLLSGIDTCLVDGEAGNSKVLGEGADQSVSGTATDAAGNTQTDTASGINIDETGPTVGLVGGPADGGVYYFGSVPAAPTCSASDGLSGLDGSCSVTGYSNGVGPHTVTASATDKAGNTSTTSATYMVNAWTLSGFYQPVDMNGVYNVVKGGSTVPLKFEIFAGPAELTDTAAIKSFTTQKITCTGDAQLDAVEITTTGGTSLRYDPAGGQFIQNWKTPTGAGTCYKATMTTQDGSSLTAFFKLK